MWELCISLKSSNCSNYIFDRLKQELQQICVLTKIYENSTNNIMIACEEYDINRVKLFVGEILVEAICNYYKNDFLDLKLNLPIKDGIYIKALKKALISFDKETDAFIIAKELKLDKNINLDGFYYFHLKSLREKWEELTSIANDNGYFLICPENFVDLLKFLVDNLEITHGTINVYCDEKGFKIFDELDKYLEVKEDEDLLSTLIGLSPKKINFYGDSNNEKYLLISQIFEKRLNNYC